MEFIKNILHAISHRGALQEAAQPVTFEPDAQKYTAAFVDKTFLNL